jgi:hypothetical protein
MGWTELAGLVGITMVITRGSIFDWLREWLLSFSNPKNVLRWVGMLMSCPQCAGVWVGMVWGISVRLPWPDVAVAAGVISLASYLASQAFNLLVTAQDRFDGSERMDVIQQLLEARNRRKVTEAQSKLAQGLPLTEDEANVLADEHDEREDAVK